MNKALVLKIIKLTIIFSSINSSAITYARRIYNQTDALLYAAGYHAEVTATRITSIIPILPHSSVTVDVSHVGLLSTKKRYLVVSRTDTDLLQMLSLPSLKALAHKNLVNPTRTFYMVEKAGRLSMYNQIEYSQLGTLIKKAASTAKESITSAMIDKKKLRAITNNPHKKDVASVRLGNALPLQEKNYLQKRTSKAKNALEKMIGISLNNKKTPSIAFILSGGGNRAMYASLGYMLGAQEIGLLDATTYISTLSGSTWFLGAWFASKQKNLALFKKSFDQKTRNGFFSLKEREFKLIVEAINTKVAYDEKITEADIFGLLIGNALLEDFGDNRHLVYLSDQAKTIAQGDWVFPIYTAVDGSKMTHKLHRWYEFTPFEVGGAWISHYVPTWAFGRKFSQGRSLTDAPELSLSCLFGLFGSAFAVDVDRIWKEIVKKYEKIASINDIVEKFILNQIGDKRITKAQEFNFTVGMPTAGPLRDTKIMSMIDGGFSCGVPYPPVSGERKERSPEILIFMEASYTVATMDTNPTEAYAGLLQSAEYAQKNNLKFPKIDRLPKAGLTIYKDENDPTVPLVIWMPLYKDPVKWNLYAHDQRFKILDSFNADHCIAKQYCATHNFTYKPEQADQLALLGVFTMHAFKQEIIEAIQWKIEQMNQKKSN